MTRRALLGFLAAAAVDPERLIWEPGRKLISIPAPASGTFGSPFLSLTPEMTREAFRLLHDYTLTGRNLCQPVGHKRLPPTRPLGYDWNPNRGRP